MLARARQCWWRRFCKISDRKANVLLLLRLLEIWLATSIKEWILWIYTRSPESEMAGFQGNSPWPESWFTAFKGERCFPTRRLKSSLSLCLTSSIVCKYMGPVESYQHPAIYNSIHNYLRMKLKQGEQSEQSLQRLQFSKFYSNAVNTVKRDAVSGRFRKPVRIWSPLGVVWKCPSKMRWWSLQALGGVSSLVFLFSSSFQSYLIEFSTVSDHLFVTISSVGSLWSHQYELRISYTRIIHPMNNSSCPLR